MSKKKPERKNTTSDAVEILSKLVGHDEALQREIQEASLNVRIAEMLFEARTTAGITQTELAERVGTTQSVISRLEDANYEGHSLPMLQRIAEERGRRVDILFPPGVE